MVGSLIRVHNNQKFVQEFKETLQDDTFDSERRNKLSWRLKAPAEGLTFSNF